MLVAVSKIAALRQKLLLLQATYVASPTGSIACFCR
jgi:hypothetical protein